MLQSMWSQRVGLDLATEQQQPEQWSRKPKIQQLEDIFSQPSDWNTFKKII